LVCANSDAHNSAGAKGHGAGTARKVVEWWTRYITPDGGLVVDPFCGSGTMAEVAKAQGLQFIGIEKEERYCEMTAARLSSFATLL
jgi:site-specific DNA-methyltransferase (adenine-specific)